MKYFSIRHEYLISYKRMQKNNNKKKKNRQKKTTTTKTTKNKQTNNQKQLWNQVHKNLNINLQCTQFPNLLA